MRICHGQPVQADEIPKSGFVFDVAEAFEFNDLERLKPRYRAAVVEQIVEAVKSGQLSRITLLAAAPDPAIPAVAAPDMAEAAAALGNLSGHARASMDAAGVSPADLGDFRKVTGKYRAAGISPYKMPAAMAEAFPEDGIAVGSFQPRHAAALGMPELRLHLSRGSDKFGIRHNWLHHKEVFLSPEDSLAIWRETIHNPGARAAMTIRKAAGTEPRQVIALHNPATGAFTVIEVRDGRAELLSWHRVDESYTVKEWALGYEEDKQSEGDPAGSSS